MEYVETKRNWMRTTNTAFQNKPKESRMIT